MVHPLKGVKAALDWVNYNHTVDVISTFLTIISCQEQLEHAEVSTALRYLGQYYFKNKLYDEASLCAQRCCDYNDVSISLHNLSTLF